MDYFEQYLYDELTSLYKKDDLTDFDYEELFYRFSSLDHVPEVKPYLLTMRYYGLGTAAEPVVVLEELLASLTSDDTALKGLYYDFVLQNDPENINAIKEMVSLVSVGYSDTYTKKRSALHKVSVKGTSSTNNSKHTQDDCQIKVTSMSFKCGNYSGWRFPTQNVDYLYCSVCIEPISCNKHIVVESQIFCHGKEFSKVFKDEFDITPDTKTIETSGWGNASFDGYSQNEYQWRIRIDGKTVYHSNFNMYYGSENINGFPINQVKIFSVNEEPKRYGTAFSLQDIKKMHFAFFFDTLESSEIVNVQIKVDRSEDKKQMVNTSLLCQIPSGCSDYWIAPKTKASWGCGLYNYTLHLGKAYKYEGQFSIY